MAIPRGFQDGVSGKTPVVMLHGLGATHFTWHKTVDKLKPDFETHAIDLWGYGASWPVPAGQENSMKAQAEAVIEYIEDKKFDEVHLVGHSMGGGICLHILDILSGMSPQPFKVKKMVLVAPAARSISGAVGLALGIKGMILTADSGKDVADFLLSSIYKTKVDDKDDYAAAFGVNFDKSRPDEVPSQIQRMDDSTNYAPIEKYGVETLVIWGVKDGVVGDLDWGEQLVEDLGASKPINSHSCGHAPHEELPEDVNPEIAAFLSP